MDALKAMDIHAVEQLMRSHESVKDAAVVSIRRDGADARLVGFVTLHEQALENQIATLGQSGDEYETGQVHLWESVFDRGIYAAIDRDVRPETIGRDFTGWVSAYDGSPLDKVAMNEWLDDTIETILAYSNSGRLLNVLELGTGSGMVLFSLTHHLGSYVGLEPSRKAVDFVTATAESIPELANMVHVYQGTATDLPLLGSAAPDVVVINSVAQYFPSQTYLSEVVEGILQLGSVQTIVFGDIRSYPLQREFLVTKALHGAGGKEASKRVVRERISEMEQAEMELLVEPGFFTSLPDQFPHLVKHVSILPKKMEATNELSCYRYAAILHVSDQTQRGEEQQQQQLASEIREVVDDEWIDFVAHKLDRVTLSRRLVAATPNTMAVSNIPYSKTIFARHCLDSLAAGQGEEDDDSAWLASVRESSQDSPSLSASDLVRIAQEAGYQVEISWARQRSQRGGLDAIFHRVQPSDTISGGKVLFRFPTDHQARSPSTFSNQPLQQQAKQTIQQQLFETLEDQLDMDLVPEDILFLDTLPANADGKVNRQVLSDKGN